MAFVQVAAGAFQMPAHHVVAPLAGEESGQAEPSTTGGARDRSSEASGVPQKRNGSHQGRPIFGFMDHGADQRNSYLFWKALVSEVAWPSRERFARIQPKKNIIFFGTPQEKESHCGTFRKGSLWIREM